MKTSHILLLVGGAAVAYMVWKGQTAPAPTANTGTILAPAVGAPVAAAPAATQAGSEVKYTVERPLADGTGIRALINQLLPGVGGWAEPSGGA